MKRAALAVALVLGSLSIPSCGKSAEEEGREAVQRDQKPTEEPAPAVAQKMGSSEPVPAVKAPPPPMPEPTTPAEIDQARKQAMIDGRDKDVIKYCEMAKVDPADAKTDPQVLLGCALAACRLHDPEKAKPWAKPLPKPLKEQAIKVCMANAVTL